MKHTRLDSLLLAGVGTLAVHEIAYLPGSLRTSLGAAGVSHAHLPFLWGTGGTVAVVALTRCIVSSLRSRRGGHCIDPGWLGLTIGALYICQEAAERALSGRPAATLLTEWVLWLGLFVVPAVALVLARLVHRIVDFATAATPRSAAGPSPAPPLRPAAVSPNDSLVRLAHSLVRRGPPLRTAF